MAFLLYSSGMTGSVSNGAHGGSHHSVVGAWGDVNLQLQNGRMTWPNSSPLLLCMDMILMPWPPLSSVFFCPSVSSNAAMNDGMSGVWRLMNSVRTSNRQQTYALWLSREVMENRWHISSQSW